MVDLCHQQCIESFRSWHTLPGNLQLMVHICQIYFDHLVDALSISSYFELAVKKINFWSGIWTLMMRRSRSWLRKSMQVGAWLWLMWIRNFNPNLQKFILFSQERHAHLCPPNVCQFVWPSIYRIMSGSVTWDDAWFSGHYWRKKLIQWRKKLLKKKN